MKSAILFPHILSTVGWKRVALGGFIVPLRSLVMTGCNVSGYDFQSRYSCQNNITQRG